MAQESGKARGVSIWIPRSIVSMDWFKGKFTGKIGKPHYLMGKSMVSCRFSLKPIH